MLFLILLLRTLRAAKGLRLVILVPMPAFKAHHHSRKGGRRLRHHGERNGAHDWCTVCTGQRYRYFNAASEVETGRQR